MFITATSCTTVRRKKSKTVYKKNQKIKKSLIKETTASGYEIIEESPVEIKEYYEPAVEMDYSDNFADHSVVPENRMNADDIPSLDIKKENNFQENSKLKPAPIKPSSPESISISQNNKHVASPKKEIIAVSETGAVNFAISENSVVNSEGNPKNQSSDLILKKAKTFYILDNYDQGLKLLLNNWGKFSYSNKKNNSKISAEATLLKGKLFFKKAEKTSPQSKAKEFYQKAIKSFYEVLSRYNARQCPSAPEAIKLFRKSKKQYEKLYKISVGFPPEF